MEACFTACHHGTSHAAASCGARASAPAGVSGSGTSADGAVAAFCAADAVVTAVEVVGGTLPSSRAKQDVVPGSSTVTCASSAFHAPASQNRHRPRLSRHLVRKRTHSAHVHVLQMLLPAVLFFPPPSWSLPCSRFQPPPPLALEAGRPHTNASTWGTLQTAAAALSCRTIPEAAHSDVRIAAAAPLQDAETESLDAGAAAGMRRWKMIDASLLIRNIGASMLGGTPAVLPAGVRFLLVAAVIPFASNEGLTGKQLFPYCASIVSSLRLRGLQPLPKTSAKVEAPVNFLAPFRATLLSHPGVFLDTEHASDPRAIPQAAAVLPESANQKHLVAPWLLHLPVPVLQVSPWRQRPVDLPAVRQPQDRIHAFYRSWRHRAALSRTSSRLSHEVPSLYTELRQSSVSLKSARTPHHLRERRSACRHSQRAVPLPSFSVRRTFSETSSATYRAVLPQALCHMHGQLTPAHEPAVGERSGPEAFRRSIAASAAPSGKAHRLCVSLYARLHTALSNRAAPFASVATWRLCIQPAKTRRREIAFMHALTVFQLAPRTARHTCPFDTALEAPAAGFLKAFFPRSSHSNASSSACTRSSSITSRALVALTVVGAASLRLPQHRRRSASRLGERTHHSAALQACCSKYVAASCIGVAALRNERGKLATTGSIRALQRRPQSASHFAGGLIHLCDTECPTKGHTSLCGVCTSTSPSIRKLPRTLQKTMGYLSSGGSRNITSDFISWPTVCAVPPGRQARAFQGTTSARENVLPASVSADNHCILPRPTWLQRAGAAAVYVVPYLELFHVGVHEVTNPA